MSAASLPSVYVPNDSPTSAFRSIRILPTLVYHEGHEAHEEHTWLRELRDLRDEQGLEEELPERRYKQKGTALLRCPPAPLVWLPQQFTAPCRNQTSDLPVTRQWACPR